MTKKLIIVDIDDYLDNVAGKDGNIKQATKLRGRKNPEHGKLMSKNNPMKGQTSPNRGKKMPQISIKLKDKKKPEGHGAKVSAAKKGRPNLKAQGVARPEHSKAMSDPKRNKGAAAMKEMHTCPHCGKTANLPNYIRWHGDNCKLKNE
jgi:hypothetical protein